LSDALRTVRPDLVHTHWLDMAEQYSTEVSAAGLPLTVRGHGFEFTPELVARLDRNPVVHAAYVFPHMAARCRGTSTKIRPLPAAFNPDLYEPAAEKNPRLVVRTGCALPSKDYATFLRTARLCPNHTFVLVLCRAFMKESYADEVIALKNQLDAPVEVHINWQHEEIASLMKRAGVYLHTNGRDSPFGMPISIIEAMATGSYVIGRRCAGASEFLGDAGELYDSPEEAAALIQRTESWTSQDWHRASMRSIERAYSEFASPEVTNRIVEDWLRITGKN
jgi:glycosyltransferase involved in cell wall biosynthesis